MGVRTCRDSVMLFTIRRWMPRMGTRWSPLSTLPAAAVDTVLGEDTAVDLG